MRKYKSRVARRSRRRARRGTRKQSGGFFGKLFDFLGFNKTQRTAGAGAPAPNQLPHPNQVANPATAAAPAAPATGPPPNSAATGPNSPPPTEMDGGRKTRHRRRSPRRHRK